MPSLARFHRRLVLGGPRGILERSIWAGLLPPARFYGQVLKARAWFYRKKVFTSYRSPVPVVSVGNLAVGGTGKTPLTDFIVKRLLDKGKKVAVVSRGYGGRGAGPVTLVSRGEGPLVSPEICGDEPFLLSMRNPSALVVTAPRRASGIRLAVEDLGADLVVLDDAFQHLAVERDLNIVLLDAGRPFGNGEVLPAGLLREFPSALDRCDLVVLTRSRGNETIGLDPPRPVLHCRHRLSGELRSLTGEVRSAEELTGRRGVAFAGIADPEEFFGSLTELGLNLSGRLALSDHAEYDGRVISRILHASRQADYLITTEKDGVKLKGESFPIPCYQTLLSLEFFEENELEIILDDLLRKGEEMTLSQELLKILACPKCKKEVTSDESGQTIRCESCRLAYPVRDGIPVMLMDEAVKF